MACRKPTDKLLKELRRDTYRQVVELLAEPREHVSYHEIERCCGVGGNTIKAIERGGSSHHCGTQAAASVTVPARRSACPQ